MKLRYWGVFALAVSVILVAVFALAGCDLSSPPAGQVHPTQAGPNGECVEWDGELCDDDPFDLDDLFESHKTTGPTRRPAVKPSPRPQVKVTKRR